MPTRTVTYYELDLDRADALRRKLQAFVDKYGPAPTADERGDHEAFVLVQEWNAAEAPAPVEALNRLIARGYVTPAADFEVPAPPAKHPILEAYAKSFASYAGPDIRRRRPSDRSAGTFGDLYVYRGWRGDLVRMVARRGPVGAWFVKVPGVAALPA